MRHIAENNTHPIVGTITAKRTPKPMHNARKPSNLFFLKKLKMISPPLSYMKKQLYNRYPIIAIDAATTKYHRNIGINLEIKNTESMMHKQPAYLLYVYLISNPPISELLQKHIKLYTI